MAYYKSQVKRNRHRVHSRGIKKKLPISVEREERTHKQTHNCREKCSEREHTRESIKDK
jgi:hypothetical protein